MEISNFPSPQFFELDYYQRLYNFNQCTMAKTASPRNWLRYRHQLSDGLFYLYTNSVRGYCPLEDTYIRSISWFYY